jgi:alpha-tubulin suppressor-like RCC1 family protein
VPDVPEGHYRRLSDSGTGPRRDWESVMRVRRRAVAMTAGIMTAAATIGATVPAGAATAVAAPAITSLSAMSGPTAGHLTVAVHGSAFTGVSKVLFGGAKGSSVHVVSPHLLTVAVPAHKAARLDVRVVTGHGTSPVTGHDKFTYVAPPVVGSVTPATSLISGGTRVVVHGSAFTHVERVLFGTKPGTALHVTGSTVLAVTAPAHVAGTVAVQVVAAFGHSTARVADRFSYTAPTGPPAPPAPTGPPAPPARLSIATTALASVEHGVPYTAALAAAGGTPPYTWSASGLPLGLALSPGGQLSGSSVAAERTWPVAVTVADAAGQTAAAALALQVRPHAGSVLAWGQGEDGELGNNTNSATVVTTPVAPSGLTDVVQVVGGSTSGYALRSDGTVYAWGSNTDGQLGVGTTTASLVPEQVPGLFGVTSLGAGQDTAYAVTAQGTVLAWGENNDGQIGDGTTTNRSTPTAVIGLDHVVSVAGAAFAAFALRSDGTVWSWGDNTEGALGQGSAALSTTEAAPIPGLGDVVQVSAKIYNGFALLADGTVRGWGYNVDGEVGDVTTVNRTSPVPVLGLSGVVQIADADYDCYVLLRDGTVRSWGQNTHGQVGDGSATTRLSPVTVPGLAGVQAIAAGGYNGFAQLPGGSVAAWGYGLYGMNADGTTNDVLSPENEPSLFGATDLAAAHLAGYAIR